MGPEACSQARSLDALRCDTKFYDFPDLENMKRLRKSYFSFCCKILDERDFSFFERLILKIMTWFQMGKTVAMFRTIVTKSISREKR